MTGRKLLTLEKPKAKTTFQRGAGRREKQTRNMQCACRWVVGQEKKGWREPRGKTVSGGGPFLNLTLDTAQKLMPTMKSQEGIKGHTADLPASAHSTAQGTMAKKTAGSKLTTPG